MPTPEDPVYPQAAVQENDQAYVEQKNWVSVCRHVGHDRYNSKAAYATLQQPYALLRLQV